MGIKDKDLEPEVSESEVSELKVSELKVPDPEISSIDILERQKIVKIRLEKFNSVPKTNVKTKKSVKLMIKN